MLKPLYFLLISILGYSQSGKITYTTKIDENFYKNTKEKDAISNYINLANKNEFELKFNKTESSFKFTQSLNNDVDSDIQAVVRLGFTTSKDVFVDKNKKQEISKELDGTLILENLEHNVWEITEISKKIDNYLCYKATQRFDYTNRKNEKKFYIIEAWFAPTLPYSFGPKTYYNLPGLILELKEQKTTYYATKIELLSEDLKIEIPNGKTILRSEYDNKIKKQFGM